jgi:predicted N-acetyltransferase YhbS/ketosteroid isomerase-like protein
VSKGSVELVYRANDAFQRRDLEAFLALIDADAEVAPRGPDGGSYRGHEGVRRSWQQIFSVFPDFGTEVYEVRDFGEVLLVTARGHEHGVGSDAPFEQKFWQVVELRDDKIARWRSYRSESDGLEAMRAEHRAGPEDPTFRIAYPGDAHQIAAIVADPFEAYRLWAPSDWSPPRLGEEEELVLARALRRADVWCMLALAGGEVVGHVALAPFTAVDPGPTPSGTTNLWQLFVRQQWQGRGVAANLAARALDEAGRRGYARIRLWTPRGAIRARRFYEAQGWKLTGRVRSRSPFGLPLVQYARRVDAT